MTTLNVNVFMVSVGDGESKLPGGDSWLAALQQEHLQLLHLHQGPHSVQHQVRTKVPAAIVDTFVRILFINLRKTLKDL